MPLFLQALEPMDAKIEEHPSLHASYVRFTFSGVSGAPLSSTVKVNVFEMIVCYEPLGWFVNGSLQSYSNVSSLSLRKVAVSFKFFHSVRAIALFLCGFPLMHSIYLLSFLPLLSTSSAKARPHIGFTPQKMTITIQTSRASIDVRWTMAT